MPYTIIVIKKGRPRRIWSGWDKSAAEFWLKRCEQHADGEVRLLNGAEQRPLRGHGDFE